jgi:pyruvate/2-oxoglutarate dehydrogenase complex dihydrolipoamide acyltransferase (E2) component
MFAKRSMLPAAVAVLYLPLIACKSSPSTPAPAAPATESAAAAASPAVTPAPAEPAAPAASPAAEHIKLQHILISFAGKVPGKNITRTQEEARTLAAEVFDRAKKGEDFDFLVKTYTDDRAPGIYALANSGVTPSADEFSRDRMVPAFGEVGFSLAPGEIGIAEYDPARSPFGWHIIKRLE